jgi:hypothetical protein
MAGKTQHMIGMVKALCKERILFENWLQRSPHLCIKTHIDTYTDSFSELFFDAYMPSV